VTLTSTCRREVNSAHVPYENSTIISNNAKSRKIEKSNFEVNPTQLTRATYIQCILRWKILMSEPASVWNRYCNQLYESRVIWYACGGILKTNLALRNPSTQLTYNKLQLTACMCKKWQITQYLNLYKQIFTQLYFTTKCGSKKEYKKTELN